jgi:hypothetical protein
LFWSFRPGDSFNSPGKRTHIAKGSNVLDEHQPILLAADLEAVVMPNYGKYCLAYVKQNGDPAERRGSLRRPKLAAYQ